MCLDQIVDSIGVKAWIFNLSEIKNIIFYAGMFYVLLKKVNKNIFFLERRLYYARMLNLDYIESLLYKIKLNKRLRPMIYSFVSLYAFVLLIHKIVVYQYDTPLLETYDYLLVDVYLSGYILFIMYPRILPDNFDVNLGNNLDEDIGMVYKAFLPKYNDVNNVFKENKKDIQAMKNKNIPILILGPCLSHYDNGGEEEIGINNFINNIEIGFID